MKIYTCNLLGLCYTVSFSEWIETDASGALKKEKLSTDGQIHKDKDTNCRISKGHTDGDATRKSLYSY